MAIAKIDRSSVDARPDTLVVSEVALVSLRRRDHTIDNVRHWAAADGLSASAANSPEVRRTLRKPFAIRDRQQLVYARGISLNLANDCVGNGSSIADADCGCIRHSFVEKEFFAWADAIGLAEKLRTMRLARVSDGESFGLLTSTRESNRQYNSISSSLKRNK